MTPRGGGVGGGGDEIEVLRAQIAALEELIQMYESCVLAKTEELHAEIARRVEAEKALATAEEADELKGAILAARTENDPAGLAPLPADRPALDDQRMLASVDGDVGLLAEAVGILSEECPRALARIAAAVEQRDARELERAAHALLGAVGIFGASSAVDLASRLEAMARGDDLTRCTEVLAALEQEMERLIRALEHLVRGAAR